MKLMAMKQEEINLDFEKIIGISERQGLVFTMVMLIKVGLNK